MKLLPSFFFFVLLALQANAQSLQRVAPEQVGMDSRHLLYADEAIETAIANKDIPGAVLAVVRNGKMAYLKAYGNKRVYPNTEPMTVNTISIWLHAVNPCPLPSVPISWQNVVSSASWIPSASTYLNLSPG